MISRLRVRNFKTLVDFDLQLGSLNVLIGENGTGKSAILDAFQVISTMVQGARSVSEVLEPSMKTKWLSDGTASFGMDVVLNGSTYRYDMLLRYAADGQPGHIVEEHLQVDDVVVCSLVMGKLRTSVMSQEFPWNQTDRSPLAVVAQFDSSFSIDNFIRFCKNFVSLRPNPFQMRDAAEAEVELPSRDLSDLTAWMRSLNDDPELTVAIRENLWRFMPGFLSYKFIGFQGGIKFLNFNMAHEDASSGTYLLSNLSDGQRVLIGLTCALEAAGARGYTLLLDEVDNFLSPSVAKDWFESLMGKTYYQEAFQAIVVTHNPSIASQVFADHCYVVARPNGGRTMVSEATADQEILRDLMERGWQEVP